MNSFEDERQRLRCFDVCGLPELLNWCQRVSLPFYYEPSIRWTRGGASFDRALFSFRTQHVLSIWEEMPCIQLLQMRVPEVYLHSFLKFLPRSVNFHFGFEMEKGGQIQCKVYLEQKLAEDPLRQPGGLLFLGFKWGFQRPHHRTISKYRLKSSGSFPDQLGEWGQLIGGLFGPSIDVGMKIDELTKGIQGRGRVSQLQEIRREEGTGCFVLEVHDESSGRLSYDINLYNSELSIHYCRPLLIALIRHLVPGLPMQSFMDEFECHGEIVGHLAAGLLADESPFLTLYYDGRLVYPE